MEQILFRAMGCEIFCGIDSTHPRIQERLARVPAMFETWEQSLSRFRPNSELSQLNARTGQTVRVSDTLWRVLKLAQYTAEFSDNLVVPTLLDDLVAAGYDRPFEQMQGAEKINPAPNAFAPTVERRTWQMHPMTRSVTLAPHTHLDLNGVAKGWAVEQTAMYLGELGPAIVDAGGDMVMTAPRANGEPWHIGIEDAFAPEQENDALPILAITHGATATSGRSFRKWLRDGKPMHHLIEPRTGLPAVTDVLNATVIAPTIFQAEAAAKILVLLGSEQGMAWIDDCPSIAGLAILENGATKMNSRMEEFIV